MRLVCPLLLAALIGACTEQSPTKPAASSTGSSSVRGDPHYQLIALTCQANRQKLSVACEIPDGVTRSGAGMTPAADIIYGGQNQFVKITSTGVAYNSGTGRFTFNTTVQNLLQQAIGTTDGTTLDPAGVRVYFSSGPTVTSGSGVAAVVPDGFATFTAPGQAFYQFNQVLAQNETSAPELWTFIISPTVVTFDFVLYVSTPVQFPGGYIEINGQLPGGYYGALHPGSTAPLTAVVKTALGTPLPHAVVSWGTTDANEATVDGSGVVKGVRAGTVSITATSGSATGVIGFGITGTTRNWIGVTSTDWETGSNWGGGYTPASVDTASVPTGTPNAPLLTTGVSIGGIIVADNATVTLGGFDLTLSHDATTGTTGGGIVGSGNLILSGTGGKFGGRFPNTLLTGDYSLTSDVFVTAPITIRGTLNTFTYTTQVRSQ